MQGPRLRRCGDVTLDPNQPRCPAATSSWARACSAAAVPTVNGRPWPDASTLGSRSASTSTNHFPAGQCQVMYHSGPATRCWPSSTPPTEFRSTVRAASPASRTRHGDAGRRRGPRCARASAPTPVRQPWHVRLPLQLTHNLGDAVGGFDPLAGPRRQQAHGRVSNVTGNHSRSAHRSPIAAVPHTVATEKHQRERQRPPGSGHAANHQRGGLRGPEPAMGDRHADPDHPERRSVRITSQAELVMRRGNAERRRAARRRSAPPLRLAYRQSRTGPR
jgi:hypothetical protein